VALDIIDDNRKEKKLVGDRELFEGVDSAMKAAFYWQGAHLTEGNFIGLYVPVLVLLRPWWEVPIDGGILGSPTESRRGYLTCRYPNPYHNPPRSPTVDVTVFIVSREDLDALVKAIDVLYTWLEVEAAARFGKGAPIRQLP
jgi:hypothetical protein